MRVFTLSTLSYLAISQICYAKEYTLKDQSKNVIERRANSMKLRPNIGIIVASDSRRDESGALATSLLEKAGFKIVELKIVNNLEVKTALKQMLEEKDINAIVCIGGTGISPHDRTIEAINEISEKVLPGYGEYFRILTQERWKKQEGKLGLLFLDTRANAGVAQGKIMFAIPGSPDATQLAVTKIIIPGLPTLQGQLEKQEKELPSKEKNE